MSLSCGISVEVMEEESKKNVGNCFPSPTLSVEVDTAGILDVFFPVNFCLRPSVHFKIRIFFCITYNLYSISLHNQSNCVCSSSFSVSF